MKVLNLNNEDYFISPQNNIVLERREHQEDFPLHHHNFSEIVVILEGSGLHQWNNEIHPITIGDILYIDHNDIHGYINANNLKLDNILYKYCTLWVSPLIDEYLPKGGISERFWRINPSYIKDLEPIIYSIGNECNKTDLNSIRLVESLFLQLLITLHRWREKPTHKSPKLNALDLLFETLRNSIETPFNLSLFCQKYNLSERTLSRLFKNQTSMTINEYLHKLRLCKAMSLLRCTDLPINHIASQCGYTDSNYFSLVFKKESLKTPSEYRKQFTQFIDIPR